MGGACYRHCEVKNAYPMEPLGRSAHNLSVC